MLGIPTVLDRLIQQAIHQILSPIWEGEFSEHSYGFRPGRSAAQAVKAAQGHVNAGKRWVVDLDLEKFFDRVNHDVLMARVARRVNDRRMLALIERLPEERDSRRRSGAKRGTRERRKVGHCRRCYRTFF